MTARPVIDCVEASRAGAMPLVCPPQLVRGKETELLAQALPLVEKSGLLLDMSQVQALDAAGVGLLMTLRQMAERSGTSLLLIDPSLRTRQILALLRLDEILICSESRPSTAA